MSLREKCPNTVYFLVHIFLYSVRIQENTDQKILPIWTLFTQCVSGNRDFQIFQTILIRNNKINSTNKYTQIDTNLFVFRQFNWSNKMLNFWNNILELGSLDVDIVFTLFEFWYRCFKFVPKKNMKCKFNPFLTNLPILYPLKTPANLWFSGAFRGYKMGTLARNGLTGHATLSQTNTETGEFPFG